STLYGYSVAGLGDVNGDGYDDVAVGAPGMVDVIVGTGLANVGGVFVYFGSPAGLPAAPSKILHPTTAVAGALFGYSIAAGDVTGDGINDIIVGSPLDGISLDFGAGGINGQVGKVYVFQGGSLSGTYPTPFLNVSLNTSLLSATTIALKPLYGLAVAAVDDMNGDGKGEILVGAPLYAEIGAAAIKTGGAFLHLSDAGNTFSTVRSLRPQNGSLLGLATPVENLVKALPLGNTLWLVAGPLLTPVLNGPIDGLLFGFSVSGAGKFDNDNLNDIVVGAPGGVNLASLGGGLGLVTAVTDVLSGQILGGSAYVFNGTGNSTGVNTAVTTRLQANPTGLLGSAANLFGYSVLGGKTAAKARDGRIIIGAPSGAVLSNVLGGLQVKAGEIHIFKKRTGAVSSPVASDQTVSSPRSSSILSILTGQPINMSILFGSSIDNLYDINCDGIGDLIVGEPLSTSVGLLNANALGGAAHAYFGRADGTYQAAPVWTGTTTISPLLGVNATALFGHAVAGAGHIKGTTERVQMLVGGPSNSLDFGAGLLNLGNTLAVLNSFAFDNNGLGKAHTFDAAICNPIMLPVTITEFTGREEAKTVVLTWKTELEENIKCYELQKSVDGTNFSKIGIEFPKSRSLSNTYSNTDKHPVNGINYYRLLIRNNDGKVSYSNIISFKFGGSLAGDMVVAPNPVKTTIRVRFSNIEAGNYRMEIRNATGQLFNSKQISINQSEQVAMIDRNNNMNTGIYWLTIYDNSHSRVKTVKMLVE
ncbi:MAG: T9SS type A sorting domain-containing protein, partial [Flavitalea sp.]